MRGASGNVASFPTYRTVSATFSLTLHIAPDVMWVAESHFWACFLRVAPYAKAS